MLSTLLRFEWRYHSRQMAFFAALLFFFGFGFMLTATGFGPSGVAVNSPYSVMQSLGFLSLLSLFGVAIFGSSAVLRDGDHQMEEIVYSTPVGRFDDLFSRFAGAFLAATATTSVAVIGMIVAALMPWQNPERVAAFDVRSYAAALAVMTIPNVLFGTALLFAIAVSTRSALATYVGAVAIYFLYFAGAALTNSPILAQSKPGAGSPMLAAILDPFGLSGFFADTRYWTVAEKGTRFAGFSGMLLINRLVWIGAAIAIWTFVYRRFSFSLAKSVSKRNRKRSRLVVETPSTQSAIVVRRAKPRVAERIWLRAYLAATKLELRVLVGSVPFLLLLLLWIGLAATEIHSDVFNAEYGAAMYPTTSLVISPLLEPLKMLAPILLIYYSAEVCWRERRWRIASILDATPAPRTAMVLSKWTALTVLSFVVIAGGIVAAIGVQLVNGWTDLQPLLYLSLFDTVGWPLALFAAAAVLLHSLSPNKYVGMFLVVAVVLFSQKASSLGLEHNLWRFASAPDVGYSEMDGFGGTLAPFHWYMLHWSLVAAVLLLLAARVRVVAIATVAVAAIVSGGWIWFNTDVVNERVSRTAFFDWKADYEKQYRPQATVPQPRITAIETKVDLFPEERRYRIAGRYALLNDTTSPIRTVNVVIRREARVDSVTMPAAKLASHDTRFGIYRFELDTPLAPQARTELRFQLAFASRGFSEDGPDRALVENGSLLMSFLTFPSIGYRRSYEVTNEEERTKRGLGPRFDEEETPSSRIDLVAEISTSGDQIALASGALEREWSEGGRRHFLYRSDAPILNQFGIVSARYAVAKKRHGAIDVEVYYDAGHAMNARRILDDAIASLAIFEREYGPYPHRQLRLAEVPAGWDFGGYALPNLILLVEDRSFLVDARDEERIDLIARRVAHEVAHQWWGHAVAPAYRPGATTIVESMTKDAELQLVLHKHGAEHVARQLEIELDRYLAGRAREEEAEVPLTRTKDQPYIFYSKGAIVMNAIRDLIGEPATNAALASFVREAAPFPGRATTGDLLRHLRAVSTPAQFALIEEWLGRITIYDLKIVSATFADSTATVRIDAGKFVADGRGNETATPLNEAIEIALYGDDDALLATERRVLHSGVNTITLPAKTKPDRVVVDPKVTRIDRNRFDNRRGF